MAAIVTETTAVGKRSSNCLFHLYPINLDTRLIFTKKQNQLYNTYPTNKPFIPQIKRPVITRVEPNIRLIKVHLNIILLFPIAAIDWVLTACRHSARPHRQSTWK